VNEKIALLRTARDGDDIDAIKTASEALSTSLSKIGEAMMKDQQTTEAAAPEGEPASPDVSATDAEFTEGEKPKE